MKGSAAEVLGRLAMIAAVPALLLPVIAALQAPIASPISATSVFFYVLLGSYAVNTWLLMRRPSVWTDRAFPPRASLALVLLWTATVVAACALAWPRIAPWASWIAIPLMALSVWVWLEALRKDRAIVDERPSTTIVGRVGRILAILYIAMAVLSVAALVYALGSPALFTEAGAYLTPDRRVSDEEFSATVWFLMFVGLPWSHTLFLVSLFAVGWAGIDAPLLALILPAATNVALVVAALGSPKRRAAMVRWFFRLEPIPKTAEPPIA